MLVDRKSITIKTIQTVLGSYPQESLTILPQGGYGGLRQSIVGTQMLETEDRFAPGRPHRAERQEQQKR